MVYGGSVFAIGGGFASTIIAHKLQAKITNDVESGQFQTLDNPQYVNALRMLEY